MRVKNDVNRPLGDCEFEYGEHSIEVEVSFVSGYWNVLNSVIGHAGYHRLIKVTATHDGEEEVSKETAVYLEKEPSPSVMDCLRAIASDESSEEICRARKGPMVTPLEEQLEHTVRPVLDELDSLYEYTNVDFDINVDATVEKVKTDSTWASVRDEMGQIASDGGFAENLPDQ